MGDRVVHCWADRRHEETGGADVGSEAWLKAWEREEAEGGATCMLLADHDGPHEFMPDDQIGVTFAPAPTPEVDA